MLRRDNKWQKEKKVERKKGDNSFMKSKQLNIFFAFCLVLLLTASVTADTLISDRGITITSGGNVTANWALLNKLNWNNLTSFPSNCGANEYVYGFSGSTLNCRTDQDSGGQITNSSMSTILNNSYMRFGFSNQTTLSISNVTNFLYNYNTTTGAITYVDNQGFITSTIANATYALIGSGSDNSSWNESYANTLYASIIWNYNQSDGVGTGNLSWNETYARTIFQLNGIAYNATYESTYNATYALWAYNQTYNGSTYNATYDLWAYNQSTASSGTYNATYDTWAYNQSSPFYTWLSSFLYDYNQTAPANTYTDSVVNRSFNQTLTDSLYAPIGSSGDNSSWNQSYANTLYQPIGIAYNATYESTYNATYDLWAYNQTIASAQSNIFNQVLNTTSNVTFKNANFINGTIYLNWTEDLFGEGQPILIHNILNSSKGGVGWTNEFNQGIGWIVCHNVSLTDSSRHTHCSLETLDSTTGSINTRFGISYSLPTTEMYAEFVNLNKVYYKDGVNIHMNSTTGQLIRLERDGTDDQSLIVFTRAGLDRWQVGQRTDGTDNFYIRSAVQSIIPFTISQSPRGEITIYNLSTGSNIGVCANSSGALYGCSISSGSGNSSWNETYARTIFQLNGIAYNSSYESTYNATYALYAYNQTYSGSTYNATYDLWAYNQTIASNPTNIFDQDLNTTNNVVFNNATITDTIAVEKFQSSSFNWSVTDDGTDMFVNFAGIEGTNSLFIETSGTFIEIIANPGPANGFEMVAFEETQGDDTSITFYEGGNGHNRFWDSGSARIGGGASHLCSNLTTEVDCIAGAGGLGADLVVADDIWLGGELRSYGIINSSTEIYAKNGTPLSLYAYNQTIATNPFDQILNRSSSVTFNVTNASIGNFSNELWVNGRNVYTFAYNQTSAGQSNIFDQTVNRSSIVTFASINTTNLSSLAQSNFSGRLAQWVFNMSIYGGNTFAITSDNPDPSSTGSNLLVLQNMNPNNGRPLLRINSNSTDGGQADIRIDSRNPDIELIETDQTTPDGKYEIDVNNDMFRLNSRNSADNSFESFAIFRQKSDVGATIPSLTLVFNNSDAITTGLRIENERSSSGADSALDFFNSAGNVITARLRTEAGSSYANSRLFFDVADASKTSQTVLTLDNNQNASFAGNVSVGDSLHFTGGTYQRFNGTCLNTYVAGTLVESIGCA